MGWEHCYWEHHLWNLKKHYIILVFGQLPDSDKKDSEMAGDKRLQHVNINGQKNVKNFSNFLKYYFK